MKSRIWLCALVLLAALPTLAARRRAVTPREGGGCALGNVAVDAYPSLMVSDGAFVYWVGDFGEISRAPIGGGGTPQSLGFINDGIYLSMAVDTTHVYIGVLPFDAFVEPKPGSILSVPKTGGTVGTLLSGVGTPWDLEADGTHLYWASLGTIDLLEGEVLPDGKIERARKDGSERQALAEDLSAPFDLALDGNDVYYGETGIATGDFTTGLFRVAKSGGAVTAILPDTFVVGIDVSGDVLAFTGGSLEAGGGVFRANKNGTGVQKLIDDESIIGAPRIFGGQVYYIAGDEEDDTSWVRRVDLASPGNPVTVFEGSLTTDQLVFDDCAVIVGDGDRGAIRRLAR